MAAAESESEGRAARYAACLQCTHHCHQLHGRGLPACHLPSFYSVLPSSPPCTPLSLPIPPAFLGGRGIRVDLESAPGEPLHSEAKLEGPSGDIWHVSMQGPTLGNLAFTKGWEEFVKDHGLSVGDLLLFKLLSRGFFSVTIYGNDGCEKAGTVTVQNSAARLMANAHGSKKRLDVEKILDCESKDVETKRRKVGCDKQIAPPIIDIDDDEDQDDDLIILSEVKSGKTCQLQAAQQITPSGMLTTDKVMCCSKDTKEDTLSPLNLVELPPTPSNADKNNLPVIVQSESHMHARSGNANCNSFKEDSNGFNEQGSSSSDESANEDCYNSQGCANQVEKCSQETMGLGGSTQDGHLKALLAKDYVAEAFISKRPLVSAEERQKALLAAKRFKSNRPHVQKLMKASNVYRGFWLSLPADFSSEHLPSEIQEATLLDASGKAWSARWLGSRNGLSGGWRKFSLDHGLEEGDVCVFEVLAKNKLVIKVHIFRVVELRNELPGRNHYLHKPQSWPLIAYNSRRSSRESSCSVKKMRGAIASKTTCHVAEYTPWLHTSPPTSRLNNLRRAVVRQLDPVFNRLKNQSLISASKPASTSSKEVTTHDSKTRQLDLLSNSSENQLLQSSSKLASTEVAIRDSEADASEKCHPVEPTSSKEVATHDSKVEASKKYIEHTSSKEVVVHDSKAEAPKKYYPIERLFNRHKGVVEEEFLVELEGEALSPASSRVKREGNAWWVPLSHFTKDKMSCHL